MTIIASQIHYSIVGRDDEALAIQVNFFIPGFTICDRTVNLQLPLVDGLIPTGEALDAFICAYKPVYDFKAAVERYNAAPFVDMDSIQVTPGAGKNAQQVLVERLRQITSGTEGGLQFLTRSYAPSETLTWPQQLAEARALLENPDRATPMVDAIAQARGISRVELATKITEKALEFSQAAGELIGRQAAKIQRLEAVDLTAPDAIVQILNVK